MPLAFFALPLGVFYLHPESFVALFVRHVINIFFCLPSKKKRQFEKASKWVKCAFWPVITKYKHEHFSIGGYLPDLNNTKRDSWCLTINLHLKHALTVTYSSYKWKQQYVYPNHRKKLIPKFKTSGIKTKSKIISTWREQKHVLESYQINTCTGYHGTYRCMEKPQMADNCN